MERSDPNATAAFIDPSDATLAQVDPQPPAPPADAVPGFAILGELGRGGMGVVYRARQVALNRPVALKMILAGGHAAEADRQRFLAEAEAVASLHHPGIVQVYEFGTHDGRPYFALEYCGGGSLAGKLRESPLAPREAAAILARVARAVQHAHDRGIVHRDLKPGNILLSAETKVPSAESSGLSTQHSALGFPKVADFGLAKRVADESGLTASGTILGTPSYMAPEQADGRGKEVGPAADVYALGATLYDCLTGRPPFRAATLLETVAQVVNEEPVSLRRLNPRVPADLETVCHTCLRKEPGRRYASAAALADDLERFLAGEPVAARPVGRIERAGLWAKRHPVAAGALVTAAVVALIGLVGALSVARARYERLIEMALNKNAADARHVASTVLLRLQAVADELEEVAEDRRLHDLLRAGDRDGLQAYCQKVAQERDVGEALGDGPDPVASWVVLDAAGAVLAASHDRAIDPKPLPGRDYFHGALAATGGRRPAVHVARTYRSRNQRINKFSLSAAVREPGGKPLGVVAVTLATGATLASDLVDAGQEAVLAVPADLNDPTAPPVGRMPAQYLLVVHPAYERGHEPVPLPAGLLPEIPPLPGHELQPPRTERAIPPSTNYTDPMGETDARYEGRRLAGFAPVGNTEFVVIVQQPYAAVVAADRQLLKDLARWSAAALAAGAAATALLAWGRRRAARA